VLFRSLKRKSEQFMKEVEEREGVYKLASGTLIEILTASEDVNARSPNLTSHIKVAMSMALKDGKVFSRQDGMLVKGVALFQMKALVEILQLMVEGDNYRCYIPPELAFGEKGLKPPPQKGQKEELITIPPFAVIIAEVGLQKVYNTTGKSFESTRELFEKKYC